MPHSADPSSSAAVESHGAADVLAAGGEVGHDLLAVDWAATGVGPLAGWPPSLITAVRILLTSRFAMWMACGPDLTFFCNAAYRDDTLGEKYPWALGRSARDVWAEIWPDIGPRIDAVMRTGEATWDEALLLFLERSGYVEETYHTFSYSPLTGDAGTVVGMLCVVSEETDRVIAERRMATLRDLGAATTAARSDAISAEMYRSPRPISSSAGRHRPITSTSLQVWRTRSLSRSPSSVRGRCRPGVSTRTSWPSGRCTTPRMVCRVVCGFFDVIAIFCPTSALVRVDFPAFGRPTNEANPLR